jgi:predicted permease
MHAIGRWLAETHPDTNKDWDISVVPLRDHILSNSRRVLVLLSLGAAFVLLIACANIASLMLARSTARQKETAVRLALGAGQLRILRQFLTEVGLICGIAAIFGTLLTAWVMNAFRPLLSPNKLAGMELAVDFRVLIYTAVATIMSVIATGILPAFRLSRTNLGEIMTSQGRAVTMGRSGQRTVGLLVISEVSLTLMLLMGTGLLVKSLSKLWNVNPGFDPGHLLTMTISLPSNKFDWQHNAVFARQVIDTVEELPSVDKGAVVQGIPMRSGSFFATLQAEGRPLPPPAERPISRVRVVSAAYFRVMKIPIVAGREFEPRDEIGERGKPPNVIVSKTFADRFWPGERALGKRLRYPSEAFWFTVVGIVGDVRYSSLDTRPGPELYFPEALFPQSAITLIVRSRINPLNLASRIQERIHAVDREAFVTDIKSMEQLMLDTLVTRRFSTLLITAFGFVALILAVTGIYGVIAYSVAQRKTEIGIRVAVGARPRDVTLLAIKAGLAPAILGMLLGSLLTLASTRLLSTMLFEVAPFDLGVWGVTSLILMTVATAAGYISARQAGAIDPAIALREE